MVATDSALSTAGAPKPVYSSSSYSSSSSSSSSSPAFLPPRLSPGICCSCRRQRRRRCSPLRTVAAGAAAAAALLSAMVLTAYEGLWPWRDLFPHHATLFDADADCRRVRTGPEVSCGGPWSSPCFDRSRCRRGGGGGGGSGRLSVYVHDDECSMRTSSEIVAGYKGTAVPHLWTEAAEEVRNIAASRGLLVETIEGACIVFYAVPPRGECVSKTPTWNRGQNHVLIDFNDASRDTHRSLDAKAMFAQSNMRPCYYRFGYDIAVPLRARQAFPGMRKTAPLDRKYFATFKGSLYLTGNGMAERSAVLSLAPRRAPDRRSSSHGIGGRHDKPSAPSSSSSADETVVVVEQCEERYHEHQLSWNKDLCRSKKKDFVEAASYGDLMNTTFALLPSGRSPATYRLAEALSAGALPVFVLQDFVKPFPDLIPWSEFSFTFPAEEAPYIMDTLRAVPREKLAEMQATALKVFDEFFGWGMQGTMHTVLNILEDRLRYRARNRRSQKTRRRRQ